MKSYLLFLVPCFLYFSCSNDTSQSAENPVAEAVSSAGYDSLLATELGADPYGMRTYVMALLKEGPNRDQDSLEVARIQRAHLDYITSMAEEGKLIMAGPYMDSWEVKGIYIFAVESVEEAEKLTSSDPAVKAGRLTMELHPWYGSAALMQMNELHSKIAQQGI